ncbi:MAG: phosphoribosylglycinamide formyltransferase [Oscillospiraceae bacterium]|nr:phosphoribosylglycinamide formyltransferase [Oscillospiraceae bacterium]
MVKICVLVSGGGTNLQALIDASPYENGDLSLVISSSAKAYALKRAGLAGIPAVILCPEEFETRQGFTEGIMDILQKHDIDLVVLAGFMFILTPCFSEKYCAINVHPSLIPAFCGKDFYGLRVHEAVLARGVKLTGATVHYVTEVADGGPIIAQKAIAVREDDTPEVLQKRVMSECEWPLLVQAVRDHCLKIILPMGGGKLCSI